MNREKRLNVGIASLPKEPRAVLALLLRFFNYRSQRVDPTQPGRRTDLAETAISALRADSNRPVAVS